MVLHSMQSKVPCFPVQCGLGGVASKDVPLPMFLPSYRFVLWWPKVPILPSPRTRSESPLSIDVFH